jgi:NADH dehydrogenase FAD-containing subunit
MRKVLIVGGGFGGTKALATLWRGPFEVTLVDPKEGFDFLPALPDLLSRKFGTSHLRVSFDELARRYGAVFVRDRITRIDPETREAYGTEGTYSFDDVVVATGARTNFYGNADAESKALRLRSLDQAEETLAAVESNDFKRIFVVGGGYTGVEAATHLKLAMARSKKPTVVEIVDLAGSILPGQESWVQDYARKQLHSIGVDIRLETTVEKTGDRVVLSDGTSYTDAIVLWNAGVTVEVPFDDTTVEIAESGRARVDEYLRVADRCYVVGDAASFEVDGVPLPMASYFADQQGARAARNIRRARKKKAIKPYRPRNFGLVIPLATGRGCGRLFGMPIRGRLALLIHHLAAWLRARDRCNRWGRLQDLSTWGRYSKRIMDRSPPEG